MEYGAPVNDEGLAGHELRPGPGEEPHGPDDVRRGHVPAQHAGAGRVSAHRREAGEAPGASVGEGEPWRDLVDPDVVRSEFPRERAGEPGDGALRRRVVDEADGPL